MRLVINTFVGFDMHVVYTELLVINLNEAPCTKDAGAGSSGDDHKIVQRWRRLLEADSA